MTRGLRFRPPLPTYLPLQSHFDGFRRFAAPSSFHLPLAARGPLALGAADTMRKKAMSYTGTVKFFDTTKGFGFISPDGGKDDHFVHISAVERSGMSTLSQNQRVTYELENDKRGRPSAANLSPAE